MSRKLIAVLISSALMFGNASTSAWSATDLSALIQAQPIQTDESVNSQAPLPAAGAAGIKQAQGFVQEYPLLTIALVAGVIAIVWILLDDDDDDEVPSTATGT